MVVSLGRMDGDPGRVVQPYIGQNSGKAFQFSDEALDQQTPPNIQIKRFGEDYRNGTCAVIQNQVLAIEGRRHGASYRNNPSTEVRRIQQCDVYRAECRSFGFKIPWPAADDQGVGKQQTGCPSLHTSIVPDD